MSQYLDQPVVAEQVPTVSIIKDADGLEYAILREPRGSSAKVSLFGAQVLSWIDNNNEELLFVSSKAIFKPPKAIRGGMPICFPQYSNLGLTEHHGFARNRVWVVDKNPPTLQTSSNKATLDLILKPNENDMKVWPHRFEFRLRIALGSGGELTQIARIRNTDVKPFPFTIGFNIYFSVTDISEVRVEGLETLDYLDNLHNTERVTEQGDAITFEGEVDRVYLNTPTKIAIIDHEKKRTFVLRKEGLPDAVVWNPWDRKAKALADFGEEEYKGMLCVGAAAIEKPLVLKPGEEWKGRWEISAVPTSYFSGHLDPVQVLKSFDSL